MQNTPSINSLSTVEIKNKFEKVHDKFERSQTLLQFNWCQLIFLKHYILKIKELIYSYTGRIEILQSTFSLSKSFSFSRTEVIFLAFLTKFTWMFLFMHSHNLKD